MGIDSMKISVTISPKNRTREIKMKKGSTVTDLLQKIHLKPDAIIVMRDDMPIPVDDGLDDEEELKIIHVASGG